MPYYYAILNLAKAELLRTHPSQATADRVGHGLSYKGSGSTSIRGDAVTVHDGVFKMLFEKRVGTPIPNLTRLPVTNLMSLIPEVGLEMVDFGPTRAGSFWGYHSIAMDETSAWPLLALTGAPDDPREPVMLAMTRGFEELTPADIPDWRKFFALSTRATGGLRFFQSKAVFSMLAADGSTVPDQEAARLAFASSMPNYVSSAYHRAVDVIVTNNVHKSKPLVLPLDLTRYAATFYLSSVVRYRPTKLDPKDEPIQAWLMDVYATEAPVPLLASALEGISGEVTVFEPTGFRI